MNRETMVNAEEIAFWNDVAGVTWATLQERIDAIFAPITAAALASAAPRAGEAVLDIGCGSGETVLELARAVGAGGRVEGVDVSRPMLDVARSRVREAGLANVTLQLKDASAFPFEAAAFDLAFSRFGVMFFENPVDAFANIRRALKPDGRVAFVCWRSLRENPWFYVPLDAVLEHVPKPPSAGPEAPGPVSFGNPERVRRILTSAGYRDIQIDACDTHVALGERAKAVELLQRFGIAARLLEGVDETTRAAAAASIDRAVRAHETSSGVTFDASVWLVRASI